MLSSTLAGKDVKAGDTTDITVPDALIITSQSFDIKTTTKLLEQVAVRATVDGRDVQKISYTLYGLCGRNIQIHMVLFIYARGRLQ